MKLRHLIMPLLTAVPLFLTSCATLVNKHTYAINVNSNAPHPRAKVQDSIYNLPAKIRVKRSGEDLAVTLISDTLVRDYTLKAQLNNETLYGNIIFGVLYPLARMADRHNDKQYHYGNYLFLDIKDTITTFKASVQKLTGLYPEVKKGNINLTLSIPYVNSFYLQPKGLPAKNNAGFWGVSAGLEYYYKNNSYIKLNGYAATDFFLPVPAAVDVDGDSETMTSASLNLTNNHVLGRLTLGYGPAYFSNKWRYTPDRDNSTRHYERESINKTTRSLGLSLNGYFRLGNLFFVGVVYNPSVYNFTPKTQFTYQHVISLDFMWKIKLLK